MKSYLLNNNSKNLILFFCGWGMDENPFSVLKTGSDILFVYDYTEPDFVSFDFTKYDSVKLLAFSYGVYASGIAKLPSDLRIASSVAINGTLIPVDNEYGVPIRQFELTGNMNSETVVKFRKRLFGGEKAEEHFELFEKHLPKRNAKSCTEELSGMKKYVPTFPEPVRKFDKIFISSYDRCVPTKNQLNYWRKQNCVNITNLEAGHFPFYYYEYLEEFFDNND